MEAKVETASTRTVRDTPLAATHARAGAKMGVWFGCALPDTFGDASAEFRHARESVALIDKNYRAYLSFTGPDRVRYLNAVLTNNIKDLSVGQGIVSLLLNPQGHILAEMETYAFADKLSCVSYAMVREPLMEVLDKFIIMDDVTLTDETERFGTLALEGPGTAAVVKNLAGIDLEQLSELASVDAEILRSAQVDIFGKVAAREAIPCRIVKRSPGGAAGAEFVVEREKLVALWEILLGATHKHGGGPMGYTALSGLRLEQGVPWFGYDFGEKQIPHEAGLQDSHISYTKGCYTGQEIVERVRSRGQVNRQRVGLIFSGEGVPQAGTPVMMEGKEVGFVTRAAKAWDSVPARVLGMGYVRREAGALGSVLQWAGGTATVTQFPIRGTQSISSKTPGQITLH
jgi:folate-binding protein YgfZ